MNLAIEGRHGAIELNRPDRLNALCAAMFDEIDEALSAIEASDASVVSIRGAGRAFCAGADVVELGTDAATAARWLQRGRRVLDRIERLDRPTVAVLNGHALGGGFELALSCDLVIASTAARVGLPEPTLGLIPGLGGTQRLMGVVGRHRAMRLLLTGEPLPAPDAYVHGLLSLPPFEPDELASGTEQLVTRLGSLSSSALSAIKRSVREAGASRASGFDVEGELAALAVASTDGREGVSAFLEKRQPVFAGLGGS